MGGILKVFWGHVGLSWGCIEGIFGVCWGYVGGVLGPAEMRQVASDITHAQAVIEFLSTSCQHL